MTINSPADFYFVFLFYFIASARKQSYKCMCVRMCVIVFHVTNYVWIKNIQDLGSFLVLTCYQP